METTRDIRKIENDLAGYFGIRNNIIVTKVSWGYFKTHEADMIILNKTGYLTEVEIKRSWADFLADFKKHTNHYEGKVDKMYYCVPDCIYDKVNDYLTNNVDWKKYGMTYLPQFMGHPCGIITYTDDGCLKVKRNAHELSIYFDKNRKDYKLFLEEQLALARLGALKYWSLAMKENSVNTVSEEENNI